MMTKQEWIENEKKKQEEARKAGYSDEEIRQAYKVARGMGVGYLSSYALKTAREELNKKL